MYTACLKWPIRVPNHTAEPGCCCSSSIGWYVPLFTVVRLVLSLIEQLYPSMSRTDKCRVSVFVARHDKRSSYQHFVLERVVSNPLKVPPILKVLDNPRSSSCSFRRTCLIPYRGIPVHCKCIWSMVPRNRNDMPRAQRKHRFWKDSRQKQPWTLEWTLDIWQRADQVCIERNALTFLLIGRLRIRQ